MSLQFVVRLADAHGIQENPLSGPTFAFLFEVLLSFGAGLNGNLNGTKSNLGGGARGP